MAYDVTNAEVDALAAAVAAPYGPLTRVTDVEALPAPQSMQQIYFTSNVADTEVHMTYEQLQIAGILERILEQAHGIEGVVTAIKAAIDALDTTATAMTSPHTEADYQTLVTELRDKLDWINGYLK